MPNRHVIAIGASAGGIHALRQIVRELPSDFSGSILVVVHISPDFRSILPDILARAGKLPARHAEQGTSIEPGRIYIAQPNYHLQVVDRRLQVSFGPKVNGFRPAIDPLLRSVAESFDSDATGVLLSGGMTDGIAGLLAIKAAGGTTVVQDPADAAFPALPTNALNVIEADHVVPSSGIGKLLVDLAQRPAVTRGMAMPDSLAKAEDAYRHDLNAQARGERAGHLAVFSCPHCGGVMRQTDETRIAQFLCHVGHSYEGEALLSSQGELVETMSWSLLRALKERGTLARELAAKAKDDSETARRLSAIVEDAERRMAIIQRDLIKVDRG